MMNEDEQMPRSQRFPFIQAKDSFGDLDAVPSIPVELIYRSNRIDASGLLDTGASVNVLSYSLSLSLGAKWESQTLSVQLAGNLSPVKAKGIAISTRVGKFAPVNLVFAWAKTDDVPLLLGRMNFFLTFDVCFYRSQMSVEIHQRRPD